MTEQQEIFLEVLTKSMGVVSLALQTTQIERNVFDGWLKNQVFKKRVEEINETSLDFVENKLLKKIKDDDLNAIQFYLKTKGKNRGY
jgi:hypothetical protein